MGKVLIKESSAGKPVPFLRGILTRSLQDGGLSFRDAYRLATRIRHQLSRGPDDKVISGNELRRLVEERLREGFGEDAVKRYSAPLPPPTTIYVVIDEDRRVPFSRAQHQRCLEPCGLNSERAGAITAKVYDQLLRSGRSEVTSDRVRKLTQDCLQGEEGTEVAQRYLSWTEFVRSSRPLVVLIGGAPGCGKSTIATELAHRLDIVRIQSTDMLREVMRVMMPQRLLPALHTSTFNAGRQLPISHLNEDERDHMVVTGYRTQADLLALACEAAVQRALHERVSLILEGVHIYPELLEKIPKGSDALIVPIMMGVLKPEELRDRYKSRSKAAPERRKKRYLRHFDDIWRLQSYLLSEADQARIPIIANDDKEVSVQQVLRVIINQLEEKKGRAAR